MFTSVALLTLAVTSCLASYRLPPSHCPAVPRLPVFPGVTCEGEVCSPGNDDCDEISDCCWNKCATFTCTTLRASCTENGQVTPHHNIMNFLDNGEDCGFCWCQNGKKECTTWSCNGPQP